MYAPQPPPYVMLQQPSPYYQPGYGRRPGGGSCCGCIFCIYCCLFLLIVVQLIIASYLFVVYDPKIPSYKIERLEVKSFNISQDFTVETEALATIKAENPNTKIGFEYGSDSEVKVEYLGTEICSGNLPEFHQGHENTTMVQLTLKGKSNFGSAMQQSLAENRKAQRIPLLVKVKVPVRVDIVGFTLEAIMVKVDCNLVVDNFEPNKPISILSREITVHYAL